MLFQFCSGFRKSVPGQAEDDAAKPDALRRQRDGLRGDAAVNRRVKVVFWRGNEEDRGRVVEDLEIRRVVARASVFPGARIGCRLSRPVDAPQQFRILDNAEVPGLEIVGRRRRQGRLQQRVQLFIADLPGSVGAVRATLRNGAEHLVFHHALLFDDGAGRDTLLRRRFNEDSDWMQEALRLAGGPQEVPVRAVIVRKPSAAGAHNRQAADRDCPRRDVGHPPCQDALGTARLDGCDIRHPGALPHVCGRHPPIRPEPLHFAAFDSQYGCCGSAAPADGRFSPDESPVKAACCCRRPRRS